MTGAERATRRVGTPVGPLAVTAGPDGVTRITWEDPGGDPAPPGDGTSGSEDGPRSGAVAGERAGAAARQLAEYARGERRSFDLELDLPDQPPFRRRVLHELGRVPYGETVSYGELAERCGRPRAARAVGNAVGRNPVPVVLPCHRVIRADGSPGEYGGGRERKRWLLRLEGARPGLPPGSGRSGPRAASPG